MEAYKQFISSVWYYGSAKLIREYLVLTIVLLSFISLKESLGKLVLANNFNVKK